MKSAKLIVALYLCFTFYFSKSESLNSEPYVLVASIYGILKVNMTSRTSETLFAFTDVRAIDYHYERNLLFWTAGGSYFGVMCATISNSTIEEHNEILVPGMGNPTGLAVDWIHDKVYWIEQETRVIRVYDIKTKEISVIAQLPTRSAPTKLKVVPHIGLLFWGDNAYKQIFSTSINGTGEITEVINTDCPDSVAINYRTGSVYAFSKCEGPLKMRKINGSDEEIQIKTPINGRVYGATMYDNKIIWTKSRWGHGYLEYAEMENEMKIENYFDQPDDVFSDVAVVDRSNQPSESELIGFSLCNPSCHRHGKCTQDGVCVCQEGWTGPDCETDESISSSTPTVSTSSLSIITLNSTSAPTTTATTPTIASHPTTAPPITISPPTTTALSTTTAPPITTAPPTTTAPPSTTAPPITTAPPTTTAPPSTTAPPPTRAPPTTTAQPTTTAPPTTTGLPPTDSPATSTPHTSTIASNTAPFTATAPFATTDLPTTAAHPTTAPPPTTTAHPTTQAPQTTVLPITDPDRNINTDHNVLQNDKGLNKGNEEKHNETVIIVIVTSAAGIIIFLMVTLYSIYLIYKCRRNHSGSYNVHKRHSIAYDRRSSNRRQSEFESGTESTHSSFRDITRSCEESIANNRERGRPAQLVFSEQMTTDDEQSHDMVHVEEIQFEDAESTQEVFMVNSMQSNSLSSREHSSSPVSATNPIYLEGSALLV